MTKVRVLCLHGFTSSGARLAGQLAPVVAASAPWASFHFVDAPLPAAPGWAWWRACEREREPNGEQEPAEYVEYAGWAASRAHLLGVLAREGPFDGVLGFSQGGAAAALLRALPEFREFRAQGQAPGLAFAVVVGGFTARDPELRRWLEVNGFDAGGSSLHVWGEADDVVPPRASERLCERFARPARIVHSGAHVIPSDDDDLDKWTAFFRERAEAKAAKAAREARDARDAHDAHDKAKH